MFTSLITELKKQTLKDILKDDEIEFIKEIIDSVSIITSFFSEVIKTRLL